MTTWPNPARPGKPIDASVTRWHWLQRGNDDPQPFEWSPNFQQWWLGGNEDYGGGWQGDAGYMGRNYTYLGPVLTPEEVQNLRDDLASAERERAHQHGRADRNAAEYAREQARREALQARVAELEAMLTAKQHFVADEPLKAFVETCAALTGGKDGR